MSNGEERGQRVASGKKRPPYTPVRLMNFKRKKLREEQFVSARNDRRTILADVE